MAWGERIRAAVRPCVHSWVAPAGDAEGAVAQPAFGVPPGTGAEEHTKGWGRGASFAWGDPDELVAVGVGATPA